MTPVPTRSFDPGGVSALTFDCYGTLVDWLAGVRRWARESTALADAELEQLVRDRDAADRTLTAGEYRPYGQVLRASITEAAARQGIELPGEEADAFAASMPAWPPFEESAGALAALAGRYRLAILSNVENVVLERSVAALGAPFELTVTAEDLRSYKPAEAHFHAAAARLDLAPGQILHVACSTYHDIRPARGLGWNTAWIDREGELLPEGLGMDLKLPDLSSLVRVLGA